jgi:hypothetical protein
VPKQSLQDSLERLKRLEWNVRAHGPAQQMRRRLSRQECQARDCGVVNLAINIGQRDANHVASETPGRGAQSA